MGRRLAGLLVIVVVVTAGVWAVASMVTPSIPAQREPALVVPAASPSPDGTLAPVSPTPSASASPTPSDTASSAPGTVAAPKPSYYEDDHGGDRDDDKDRDDKDDDG